MSASGADRARRRDAGRCRPGSTSVPLSRCSWRSPLRGILSEKRYPSQARATSWVQQGVRGCCNKRRITLAELSPQGTRLTPGGFCMWCSGLLSKEKLDAELNEPNRNYFANRSGEAQVVSLNGLVESQAVTEVLQLLTGFGRTGLRRRDVPLDGQPNLQGGFRKLNGVRGTLDDWGAIRRSDCSCCSSMVGAGTISWGVRGAKL